MTVHGGCEWLCHQGWRRSLCPDYLLVCIYGSARKINLTFSSNFDRIVINIRIVLYSTRLLCVLARMADDWWSLVRGINDEQQLLQMVCLSPVSFPVFEIGLSRTPDRLVKRFIRQAVPMCQKNLSGSTEESFHRG